MTVTLALAQLALEPAAVERNRDRALSAVADAADRGADLVVLPELFPVGYFAFEAYARSAEPLSGPVLSAVSGAAADHGVAVLAGTVVEDLAATAAAGEALVPGEEGLANTAVLFDREGRRRLVYRKRHLFGYDSAGADRFTPGADRVPTAEFGGFTVGVATCYDARFPEQFRAMLEAGVTLFLVPSAWPYPRVEHWQLLPRARAVENLAYVAAANGVGEFETATLLGRSTVYDPWGTPVASAGDDPTLVVAEADPDRVEAVRGEFPAVADRLDRDR